MLALLVGFQYISRSRQLQLRLSLTLKPYFASVLIRALSAYSIRTHVFHYNFEAHQPLVRNCAMHPNKRHIHTRTRPNTTRFLFENGFPDGAPFSHRAPRRNKNVSHRLQGITEIAGPTSMVQRYEARFVECCVTVYT